MLITANFRKRRRAFPLLLIGLLCLSLCSGWASAGQDPAGLRLFANVGGFAHALAVSPDWKSFATVSIDGDVRIYDADTGFELRRMMGQSHIGCEAAYSPDGRLLLTTSGEKTLTVWNAADGKELLKVSLKEGTSAVAFAPDGKRFAVACFDHATHIFDTRTGAELVKIPQAGIVEAAAFSPDGNHLALVGWGGMAHICDSVTGKVQLLLRGHRSSISGVAYSGDGSRLATCGGEGTAIIWDAKTGEPLVSLKGHEADALLPAVGTGPCACGMPSRQSSYALW
ncbi:MAG TPA: PQQ-binding-like beta-propeller repeat protein [Tepidisphaeraceae bacterium]|jgi:WD40 repeat protein|nr:PQQ-binding-like beta-propeller repeat protein [Tepidisphaeraceae bacterium]